MFFIKRKFLLTLDLPITFKMPFSFLKVWIEIWALYSEVYDSILTNKTVL